MAEANTFSILDKGDNVKSGSIGIFNQVADFGRGVVKGGLEDPVNGLVQISNKVLGTGVPDLQLVNQEKASRSVGGMLGNMTGKVIDFALIAMATKNMAVPTTATQAVLRSGAIGAIYGGVLTPSNPNSESFIWDRTRNGAISFATFAAMGAAGAKLDSTAMFNVAEGRSLFGNIAYSGMTGAAGGLANAETNAILYQGRILPKGEDLAVDLLTWTAFGAVSGSVNYGVNQFRSSTVVAETKPGHGGLWGNVEVKVDSAGNPVKVTQLLNGDYGDFLWTSRLKTDGKWYSSGSGPYETPTLISVKIDSKGMITTMDHRGNNRYYTHGARFDSDRTRARELADAYKNVGAPTTSGEFNNRYEARAPKDVKLTDTGWVHLDEKTGAITSTVRTDNNLGLRSYDASGRLQNTVADWKVGRTVGDIHWTQNGSGTVSNSFGYSENGLNRISVNNDVYASLKAPNTWEVRTTGYSLYKLDGRFEVIKPEAANGIEQIRFVSSKGTTTTVPASDSVALKNLIQSNSVLEPGATGFNYIKVSKEGIPTLVTNKNTSLTVNGKTFEHGAETVLKPGDQIIIKADVGDRYPIWKTFDFQWIKDAKQNKIGGYQIEPGKSFDLTTTY